MRGIEFMEQNNPKKINRHKPLVFFIYNTSWILFLAYFIACLTSSIVLSNNAILYSSIIVCLSYMLSFALSFIFYNSIGTKKKKTWFFVIISMFRMLLLFIPVVMLLISISLRNNIFDEYTLIAGVLLYLFCLVITNSLFYKYKHDK